MIHSQMSLASLLFSPRSYHFSLQKTQFVILSLYHRSDNTMNSNSTNSNCNATNPNRRTHVTSDVNPNQHGHGMFNSVGNNGEEGVYCIRNGNELSHATRIHMGLPPNSFVYYFDDVNPNNATHLPMRVVANPGSAAKPLFGNQDHVVNPNYATHHCMGVVANPGSAAKTMQGIPVESQSLPNSTHGNMNSSTNDPFTIHRDHAYYSGLFSGVKLGYCTSTATSGNSKYFVSLPFFHKSSTHSLRIVTISLSSTR